MFLFFYLSDFIGRICKLINRYSSEIADLFNSTAKNTGKNNKCIPPTVFPYIISPMGTFSPTLSRSGTFLHTKTFFKKPTQMNATQYSDLFVTYMKLLLRTSET